MNKYETILVISAQLDDSGVAELVEKYSAKLSTAGAESIQAENWGTQEIAHPVKSKHGRYLSISFEANNPELVSSLNEAYRIDTNIYNFETYRTDHKRKQYKFNKRLNSSEEVAWT